MDALPLALGARPAQEPIEQGPPEAPKLAYAPDHAFHRRPAISQATYASEKRKVGNSAGKRIGQYLGNCCLLDPLSACLLDTGFWLKGGLG